MKKTQTARFWDKTRFPVAVAHRGGDAAGIEKENSLKAFQAAYDLGYRWFETDVVPTKDGVLLAIHGRGLQKKANKDLPARLKIQQITYDNAKTKLKVGGEIPLTLTKLLDSFPDTKVFIDPKTYKAGPLLADFLISRPQDLNRVCVGSYHGRNTRMIRKRVREATGIEITCGAIGKFRGLPLIISAKINFFKPILKKHIQRTNLSAFYLPCSLLQGAMGKSIVDTAHSLDTRVAAYTANDRSTIEACLQSGADAVMSDNVDLLKEYIKQ